MIRSVVQVIFACLLLSAPFVYCRQAMSKNICEEMDRKLGKIVDSPQIPKPCDTKIQLLQGEALLIPRIPTCPISTFDVQFTGAMKDPISNSVVTTDLLYENQRLFVEERRIIPNGLRNNAYTITRSLQMSEDADHAKNMVSVACQLLDPTVKSSVLRVIKSANPNVDCSCESIYSQ